MQTLCVQLFVHSLVLLHQWNGIVGVCDVIFNTRALLLAQVWFSLQMLFLKSILQDINVLWIKEGHALQVL